LCLDLPCVRSLMHGCLTHLLPWCRSTFVVSPPSRRLTPQRCVLPPMSCVV
jgi:hypothetical protein